MRIALVAGPYVPVPPPKYGGTERVIQYLIKGLLEHGHEPILVGTGDSKVDCELVPIIDKAISFAPTRQALPAHQKLVDKTNARTKAVLSKLLPRIDLIHSHGFDLTPFQDFPNLTTLHDNIDFDNIDYFLKHKDLPYVSISKNQQRACPGLNYIGLEYHGEDPEEFPIVTTPQNYVCFIGRFDREKNPHLAIQLAIDLGIPIKLAGKIDFLGNDYFNEEIKPFFSHPLVEYVGELGFADKVELMSNAKCNLHPIGFREPFGLTVLEAAYCGTPTMAIHKGSMPEVIKNGETGVLVEDFIEGIYRLQECFDLDREHIAVTMRAQFNYRTMTSQYLHAYKRALRLKGAEIKEEE
ncbi:MAG: Group 1 glycosyl transferase [Candidatus Saccharibacteria bacterium]|nr:Group 1 glycosyl transferase [Candidatus Saccharibacteria bacterium]